jgi:hypothetical protein
MSKKRDFSSRLKDLGIEIANAAKKEYKAVVSGAEKQIRKDKLRKRFNLENPYRFVLLDSKIRVKLLDGLMAKHAKRYDEDDILVFFGSKEDNNFQAKQQIKDLSDETIYEVIETVDVTIPVKFEEKVVEVACTAIYGKVL